MKTSFANLVRGGASARSFSLQTTRADAAILAVLGAAAAGAAFLFANETTVLWRALVALQAAVAAGACFVLLRALVPLVLSLSFADMIRLRTAFYLWSICLVGLVALSPVTRALFTSLGAVSLSLTLTLAAIALAVRFLRRGSMAALTLAFAGAGIASGLSAFGLVAAAVAVAVLKVAAVRLLGDDGSPYEDELGERTLDYFVNPLVRSRTNWVLALGFLACAATAFFGVRTEFASEALERFRIPWDYGVSLDGAAFLLATGILPFGLAVGKTRRASDVFERLGAGLTILYIAIAAVLVLMLINPALFLLVTGLPLRVETGTVVLSGVLYAYTVLLSVTCLLIDVRCRVYDEVTGERVTGLRWATKALYALACVVPVALFALVAAIPLLRQ